MKPVMPNLFLDQANMTLTIPKTEINQLNGNLDLPKDTDLLTSVVQAQLQTVINKNLTQVMMDQNTVCLAEMLQLTLKEITCLVQAHTMQISLTNV